MGKDTKLIIKAEFSFDLAVVGNLRPREKDIQKIIATLEKGLQQDGVEVRITEAKKQ